MRSGLTGSICRPWGQRESLVKRLYDGCRHCKTLIRIYRALHTHLALAGHRTMSKEPLMSIRGNVDLFQTSRSTSESSRRSNKPTFQFLSKARGLIQDLALAGHIHKRALFKTVPIFGKQLTKLRKKSHPTFQEHLYDAFRNRLPRLDKEPWFRNRHPFWRAVPPTLPRVGSKARPELQLVRLPRMASVEDLTNRWF
jgi:hypothetical protein